MFKVLLLSLLLVASLSVEVTYEDDVAVLTDKTFDEFIGSHPYVLAEFYAPWCGHCKKLAPEYSKAAKQLAADNSPIFLAKVDATAEKEVGQRMDIKGYPTLKFFINGSPIEYNGGRTAEEIVNWLNKKTGPSTKLFTEEAALEKFIADNEVAVVFFGEADSEAFHVFEKYTKTVDEFPFGHVFEDSLISKHNAAKNSVVLFKQFDEKRNDYTGKIEEAEISAFVSTNSLPTIIKFDQKAAQKIFGDNKVTLFLFISEDETSAKAVKELEEAAPSLKGKILLSTSQIRDGIGKRLGDYIGVTESELPCVRIVNPNGGETRKYSFEGEINDEALVKFYDDYHNGRLKPVYKSAPVPEKNDEPVKVVVGGNFKDIVLDHTKDVLLEFYAPWCGHCKSLAPIYDKVAELLKVNPNIVLAKCDATANEIEGIPISGFPTLKFFPSNNKNTPLDFNGERTEEGILKYLKEHATVAWVDVEGSTKTETTEDKKTDL